MSTAQHDIAWAFAVLQEYLLKMPARTIEIDGIPHAFLLREDALCSVERIASQYTVEARLKDQGHTDQTHPHRGKGKSDADSATGELGSTGRLRGSQ